MTTKQNNAPGRIFTEAFTKIEKEINYSSDWQNGTAYFDNAVEGEFAPKLNEGEIAKFTDQHGRRAIIIGTFYGNVLVFDRYANQNEGGVYVTNAPVGPVFTALIPSGAVSDSKMLLILGGWGDYNDDNIGCTIRRIHKSYTDKMAMLTS